MKSKYSKALIWLSLTVFILTAVPRLNIKIGLLPLYGIDFFIFMTFVYSLKVKSAYRGKRPFSKIIILIIIFVFLGEFSAVLYSGEILNPVYILIRTFLAFSLFFSASRIIQNQEDLLLIFKAVLLGVGISSLLMIMSSLPFTRSFVANSIFSISYLEPAADQAVRRYTMEILGDIGVRGKSLIGVSIMSGAFINIMWPFVALLLRWPWSISLWRNLALVGTLLAPLAAVMSYSRGAILGMFLVVGGVLFFGSSRNRQGIIIAVLTSVSIFSFFGWDSDLFYFERLEVRTRAMIENPYEDVRESERIYSYTEPFEHVVENPQFFLIGEGTSIGKTGVISEQSGMASHAVFAQAYYSYGMVAAFIYMFLIIRGFTYTRRQIQIRKRMGDISLLYAQALFAALLGMLPWLAFGHAAVSTPRGAMMFFLLFGMIASLKNFPINQGKGKGERKEKDLGRRAMGVDLYKSRRDDAPTGSH